METRSMLESRNGQIMLEPKWRSNPHLILLVGEGDFSFSSCLASAFGAATHIVATSLDSRAKVKEFSVNLLTYVLLLRNLNAASSCHCVKIPLNFSGELVQKYGMQAVLNTFNLYQRGALVLHGFDACKMATQQRNLLGSFQSSFFHRIIFNFPHAGFLGRENDAHLMQKHKELVRLFFANARDMLLPGGQVHVSHKLGYPYDEWMLEEQARVSGFRLVKRVPFHREHYPGYQNRRGDGSRAGDSFKLGPADTFIFAARIEEPRSASSFNGGEPLGMSSDIMLDHLKSLVRQYGKA